MKKMKNVVCGIFAAVLCMAITPSQGIALSYRDAGLCPAKEGKVCLSAEKAYFLKDRGLLSPNCNCDPHMLLPGNTAIDPKFLLKPGGKGGLECDSKADSGLCKAERSCYTEKSDSN